MSGISNSCHEMMNMITAQAASPGAESGRYTRKNADRGGAPSEAAALSSRRSTRSSAAYSGS